MARLTRIVLVAFLAALVIQSRAFAQQNQTTDLPPTDDAYVNLVAPSSNYGSAPTLQLSWSVVPTSGGEGITVGSMAYLKFNLPVSQGNVIQSAALKLHVIDGITPTSIIVVMPEKDTAWKESTINGNNAPDVPTSQDQIKSSAIAEENVTKVATWYSFNITSYVRYVGTGLLALQLVGGNTQPPLNIPVDIDSSKSKDPTLRPYLELTYGGAKAGLLSLTLRSNLAGTSLFFNGTQYKIPSTLGVALDVPAGRYTVSATPTVTSSNTTREVFQKWNDGSTANPRAVQLNQSMTIEADYLTQYYLNVTTQYGAANGTGWYGNGSTANVEVSGNTGANPPRVQVPGILGTLGVGYVFDHWSGYTTRSSNLPVVVDGPLTITAIWVEDFSLLYSNLLRGILALGAGLVAGFLVRRRLIGSKPERVEMGARVRTSFTDRLRSLLKFRSTQQRAQEPVRSVLPKTAVGPEAAAEWTPLRRAEEPVLVPPLAHEPATRRPAFTRPVATIPRPTQEPSASRTTVAPPLRTVPTVPLAEKPLTPAGTSKGKITKYCYACGAKILRESKFCEECGTRLVSITEAESQSSETQKAVGS